MLETAFILRTATDASLVLIDELGRGTSTYDGLGIAWAVASELAENGTMCIFATHFHELTALEARVPGTVNVHVSAHVEDGALTLLYKIATGPCHQSFGVEVAELAQLPDDIISLAKEKLAQFSSMDHIIELAKQDHLTKDCEKLMEEFCSKCDAIMEDNSLDDDERMKRIREARDELRSYDNPLLSTIIKSY
ncbi:DNA mismatch repair protein Msh2-like [Tropilaelaps mercedesae]|uniref:DNA mismatch repair protein Msh2-like n=1 Tax=Tropilaelaps mercedesae TaxID=418985 RepID=A0A1V9XIW7_9ACAR|nr:DNA mismatch repair protein Msh2-like [Tropilaelaps mercedesae]